MTRAPSLNTYAQDLCRADAGNQHHLAVCHIISGYAWAGAEVQVATMLRALRERKDISLQAIVFHDGRLRDELHDIGVAVFMFDWRPSHFTRSLMECARFLDRAGVKVLHSHNYQENLLAVTLGLLRGATRLVRTEHGHPESYSVIRNLKHCCVLAVDRWAARYTNAHLIAVSSDLGNHWRNRVGAERVTVLHNAVSTKRVVSMLSAAEAKEKIGLTAASRVVGIVGRLEDIKRHDLFVAAAISLTRWSSRYRFVIAGAGRKAKVIRAIIAASGVEQKFRLLGERNDIYDVLRAVDALLICSDHEGIPMVLLEAMALGTAVVSRKVGGITEILRHNVNGLLVDSDNPGELATACASVCEDDALRSRLTQAATDDITHCYSAERHAAAMLALYRSTLRNQRQTDSYLRIKTPRD